MNKTDIITAHELASLAPAARLQPSGLLDLLCDSADAQGVNRAGMSRSFVADVVQDYVSKHLQDRQLAFPGFTEEEGQSLFGF